MVLLLHIITIERGDKEGVEMVRPLSIIVANGSDH